jgi:membrane protein
MLKDTVLAFIDDEALSRGAAIAFYTVTSLAPVLLLVIAIAGLVFGEDAARGAILGQLTGLMGQQAADVLQSALASASTTSSGVVATIVGAVTLLATASGMFGEMQVALNRIWKAEPKSGLSNLVRARAASLGLVAALGFLLVVSLVVSAAITALGGYLNAWLPFGETLLSILNGIVSLALLTVLFAAIYKVLPDRAIAWRDVIVGAAVTAVLFTIGKSLIGWYLGSSAVASSYGAAGGLILLFLWVYYSTQLFLAGAEFTKVYATRRGRGPVLDTADAATSPGAPAAVLAQRPKPVPASREGLSPVELAARDAARNREAWVATVNAIKYRLQPSVLKRNAVDGLKIMQARAARNLRRDARERPVQVVAIAAGVGAAGWAVVHALTKIWQHRRMPRHLQRG